MPSGTVRAWDGGAQREWKVAVTGAVSKTGAPRVGDHSDDRAVVHACLAGSHEAFGMLVERHRRSVYQLCYRFVGNHEDASDLAQEVFLRAHRGLRKFRGGSSLATWLYRIGVNVCLSRVKTRKLLTEPIQADQHVDTRSEDPAESVLRAERATMVRSAIARLPPKQRATLILRIYHELSHEEIAGILGNSVGAVKANFFHALANLKKVLEEIRRQSPPRTRQQARSTVEVLSREQ